VRVVVEIESALFEHGLLLVQGQAEVPSIADLLAGAPVTTRGYSWDYVPAKRCAWELEARAEVASCKLLRGRTTLVHARLWPAVHGLAVAARAGVSSELLDLVERHHGISGDDCKAALALDSRAFQREKRRLERFLCVWSAERPDEHGHTHDRAWHPWATGKIARGVPHPPAPDDAIEMLLVAVRAGGSSARDRTLIPAISAARR
jgi:hypothetical protein